MEREDETSHGLPPEHLSTAFLGQWVTQERKEKIEQVLKERSTLTTIGLEHLYDTGNINAVLRSAESLGFPKVDIIDSPTGFKTSKRITQGAHKWIEVQHFETTQNWIDSTRLQKRRIVVATLDRAQPIDSIDWSIPSCLIFGNEKVGPTRPLLESAEVRCFIPMQGFSESFNVSVAAALFFYHIREWKKRHLGHFGDLTTEQKERLRRLYLYRSGNLFRNQHRVVTPPLTGLKKPTEDVC